MTEPDIAKQLLKGQRWQMLLTVVLYVIVFAAIGYVWTDSMATRDTLCKFRADLVQRVATSQQFVDAHPRGALGLTKAQIQSSIDNQQRTIDSLSGLRCGRSTG